jgi:hypothetical protein
MKKWFWSAGAAGILAAALLLFSLLPSAGPEFGFLAPYQSYRVGKPRLLGGQYHAVYSFPADYREIVAAARREPSTSGRPKSVAAVPAKLDFLISHSGLLPARPSWRADTIFVFEGTRVRTWTREELLHEPMKGWVTVRVELTDAPDTSVWKKVRGLVGL